VRNTWLATVQNKNSVVDRVLLRSCSLQPSRQKATANLFRKLHTRSCGPSAMGAAAESSRSRRRGGGGLRRRRPGSMILTARGREGLLCLAASSKFHDPDVGDEATHADVGLGRSTPSRNHHVWEILTPALSGREMRPAHVAPPAGPAQVRIFLLFLCFLSLCFFKILFYSLCEI
jgi:hypothetical protein